MTLVYNPEIVQYFRTIPRQKKKTVFASRTGLGEGASGKTYTVTLKRFPNVELVTKKMRRTRYADNEFEALTFLRSQMIAQQLPAYYIFMYATYCEGKYKYLVLEKADYCLSSLMVKFDYSKEWYIATFQQIATAVRALEALEFNHGDLWDENIMVKFHPGQEKVQLSNKTFDVKFIDYDCSFKPHSRIRSPNLGGGNEHRNCFYLGYDLNRYFDSLIFAHNNGMEKRAKYRKRKAKKLQIPEDELECDSSEEQFNDYNVVYPESILKFIQELPYINPEEFTEDLPEMSGERVLELLKTIT